MKEKKENNARAWLLAAGIIASYTMIGESEAMLLPGAETESHFNGATPFDENRARHGVNDNELNQAIVTLNLMRGRIKKPVKKSCSANAIRELVPRTMVAILNTIISHNEDENKETINEIAGSIEMIRFWGFKVATKESDEETSRYIADFLGYGNDMTLRWYICLLLGCVSDTYKGNLTYSECLRRAQYLVFRICEVWYAMYIAEMSADIQRDIQSGDIAVLTPEEKNDDISQFEIMREYAQKTAKSVQNGDLVPVFVSELSNLLQEDPAKRYIDFMNALKGLQDAAINRGLNMPRGFASVVTQGLGLNAARSLDFQQEVVNVLGADGRRYDPIRTVLMLQKTVHNICDIWKNSKVISPNKMIKVNPHVDKNLPKIQSIRPGCVGEAANALLVFFKSLSGDKSKENIDGLGQLFANWPSSKREALLAKINIIIMSAGRVSTNMSSTIEDYGLEGYALLTGESGDKSQSNSNVATISAAPLQEKRQHKHYLTSNEKKSKGKTDVPSLLLNDDDDEKAADTETTGTTETRPQSSVPSQSKEKNSSSNKKRKSYYTPKTKKTDE